MSDFLLEPPVSTPIASSAPVTGRPVPLGGVDWAGLTAEARGDIALVEVEAGEGELQEWGRRGNA